MDKPICAAKIANNIVFCVSFRICISDKNQGTFSAFTDRIRFFYESTFPKPHIIIIQIRLKVNRICATMVITFARGVIMYNFYAFLDRMKYIRRWSLMRSSREENIMEHSQQVAMFAHALAVIDTEICHNNPDIPKTVLYALYHETSEVMTGDLPTPIKYFNAEIHGAYKQLEDRAADKLLDMLPEPLRESIAGYVKADANSYEYKLVKAADKLSAYVKCLEELKSGNAEFKRAKESIEEELKAKNMPCLRYFIEQFIPGFLLTLDEMENL